MASNSSYGLASTTQLPANSNDKCKPNPAHVTNAPPLHRKHLLELDHTATTMKLSRSEPKNKKNDNTPPRVNPSTTLGKSMSPPKSNGKEGDHAENRERTSPYTGKLSPVQDNSGTTKNQTYRTVPEITNSRATSSTSKLTCASCARVFTSQGNLRKHTLARECGDRSKCQHCGKSYTTYQAVRQHERRSHPLEYFAALRNDDPKNDVELLTKIAKIEARSLKLVSIRELISATGLTEAQIRSRREKPIYKKYLDEARKERMALSKESLRLTKDHKTSKPVASESKTTSNSPQELHQPLTPTVETNTEPIAAPVPSGKRPRTSTTPPAEHQIKKTPRETITYHETPRLNKRPRPESNSPQHAVKRPPTASNPPSIDNSNLRSSPSDESSPIPNTTLRQSLNSHQLPSPLTLPMPKGDNITPLPPSFLEGIIEARSSLGADDPEMANLVHLALFGSDLTTVAAIDTWLMKLTDKPKTGQKSQSNDKRNGPHTNETKHYRGTSGRGQRASAYKKAQDLYNKDKTGLADLILNNRNLLADPLAPTMEAVLSHYRTVFVAPHHEDTEAYTVKHSTNAFYPISDEELRATISSWKNAAPGSDGITVRTVKGIPIPQLMTVFNIILGRNLQPSSWKTLRTTLVPKDGDRRNPMNWRPITIGSAVQRLLHRVLNRRLKNSVKLNPNQRGFIETDGTLSNTIILDHYIGTRTSQGKSLNVVSLDLKKAFDTVSHASIERALHRHNVDKGLAMYIMSSLEGCSTRIAVNGEKTCPILITRGVKQGDPLSPILFNMVMDELLDELNYQFAGGTIDDNTSVAAIAFADDIILLHDSQENMQAMLFLANSFIRNRGMEVNTQKSTSMSAAPLMGNKICIPTKAPVFSLNGKKIPIIDHINAFRYLGHLFGTSGLQKPSLTNISFWSECVKRAPLKPDQKLCIIRDHLIPKAMYGLQNSKIDGVTLKQADKIIKALVKKILHLPVHTQDSFIQARLRDGGLGIPELRHVVPQQLLARLGNLLNSASDPYTLRILQTDRLRQIMIRLQKLAGEVPAHQLAREALGSGPLTAGIEHAEQNTASRSWISSKPRGWSGRDYVRAIHLRANCLPTAGIPSNPIEKQKCRGGCNRKETLSHVLQGCPQTHYDRIRRHNEIVNKIANHTRGRNLATETEPHVRHQDGTLFKPDLAIHIGKDEILICDIQVSWDEGDSLQTAWARKERTYNNNKFIEAANRRWPNKALSFHPIILGARGIWPRCNENTSNPLHLTQAIKDSCVHSCLKWGPTIHGSFMRRVWRKNRD